MITYIRHNDINKSKWDDCISKSFNGIVYAYSWYLDLVSPGWDALVEKDYESVFPLTKNKKFGVEYLFPPFFTQQLGLFSKNKITREKLNDFLQSIPERFRFVEINLNSKNIFDTPGFIVTKNLTHHLNLNHPYQSTYKNYNENLKRNLKKAEKFDQQIMQDADPEIIIKLFRKNKGKSINTLKDKNYKTLLKVIYTGHKETIVKVYGVLVQKHLIAGAFFIESNGKAIFIFSGSNKEAKEKHAVPLMLDAFIRDHSGKNLILDFEGSNDFNLARFYKSFGAEEIVYLQIKKNNLPYPLKWIKK